MSRQYTLLSTDKILYANSYKEITFTQENARYNKMNFVALDFETANHSRESICSVGIAIVENGKLVQSFEKLVRPTPNYYHWRMTGVHGITSSMTNKLPDFGKVWKEIRHHLAGKKVIAHNAGFDIGALRSVLDVYKVPYPEIEYYCSCTISRRAFRNLTNHRLSTVCAHLGIKLNHHNAESDAIGAAQIVLSACKANKVRSLEALAGVLALEGKKL